MIRRNLLLFVLCANLCFGQELPDRDVLVKKFLDEGTAIDAVHELYKNFGSGGLRSIVANVNALPKDRRLEFSRVFLTMDLDRFMNGVNNNLATAEDPETRAMWAMYLGKLARGIDPSALEKYSDNESEDIRVRLAAMSGLCLVQMPERYQKFFDIADKAEIDPGTGKNDFMFCDLDKKDGGLFYFAKSQLEKPKPSNGVILTCLAMAESGDTDVYDLVLKLRQKKYVPMMIDRAIQVGAVDLIEAIAKNKFTKKEPMLEEAKAAAATIQGYRAKLYGRLPHDPSKSALAAAIPLTVPGSAINGNRAGYAIVKVDATGAISVVEKLTPFGGGDPFASLKAKTLPAYENWATVESLYLVVSQ